jgi:hypothetical protein
MLCSGCGNAKAWSVHRKKEALSGRAYEECNQCFDASIPANPDVYFKGPYWDENLSDFDDPSYDPKRGTFIRSRTHKAYVMKKCNLREDGDTKHGSRAFDPNYSRIAHENFKRRYHP